MRYLLVDRVTEIQAGRSASGWKSVAMSEDFLEWHFPGRPIMPGVLVLEALVQLAGWLEASTSSFERWALLDRVVSARWYAPNLPGDRIDLRVEQVEGGAPDRRAYRGEALVDGTRRASVEFEATVVPLGTLEEKERASAALKTLRGEAPSVDPRREARR